MSKYGPKPRPAADRFWEKVTKTDTCWLWTGAKHCGGYGNFLGSNGKVMGAYRFSYELAKGEIPKGAVIDYLCRNPICVNPDHLEAVTDAVNAYRGMGWSGRNFRKTVCSRGHSLTPDNLINRQGVRKGRRDCKKCHCIRVNGTRGIA